MNYSTLKVRFRCSRRLTFPHLIKVSQYSTDDDHIYHWEVSKITTDPDHPGGFGVEYGELGTEPSKEEALRAARDRHREICDAPVSHRYNDEVEVHDYYDETEDI